MKYITKEVRIGIAGIVRAARAVCLARRAENPCRARPGVIN